MFKIEIEINPTSKTIMVNRVKYMPTEEHEWLEKNYDELFYRNLLLEEENKKLKADNDAFQSILEALNPSLLEPLNHYGG